MAERYVVKVIEDVYIFDMKAQVPTALLFRGSEYVLKDEVESEKEKPNQVRIIPYVLKHDDAGAVEDDEGDEEKGKGNKTEELRELIVNAREQGVVKRKMNDTERLGFVVARCNAILIRSKVLDELLLLKKEDKMTSLNMAGVIRKYHPDLMKSSVCTYRSAYSNFIHKNKDADIRSNTPLSEHETVTERDVKKVHKVVSDSCERGKYLDFDGILRELDMTDYKLKLVLKRLIEDEKTIETVYIEGKLLHRLKEVSET